MANTIGKFIKAGKNIFDHLDAKVNFTIPENLVSYLGVNGKQNDKKLQLNENNFRLQIGKMQKDKETIYTKEILIPAIEYIIRKTGEGEKSVIQLRPDLAKYLTNEDQKKESKQILSFEEEKQKIINLIKKYFKNKTTNIEIISISTQYPEIFSLLKEKGKDGLASIEKPILNKEKNSALSLVKYLYRLSQSNPNLMELFYNTKTPAQKEKDKNSIGKNQSDYYSLVEVGIRLYEVLSGISIQGGIDRQRKYDKIIGGILYRKDDDSFKTKNYPELEELHTFCKEINPDFVFERIRIGVKDAEKVGEEIQRKKQSLSRLKARSLITSVALMGVLAGGIGGYKLSEHIQKKDIEQKNTILLKKNLEDKYSQKAYFDSRERMSDAGSVGLEIRVRQSTDDFYDSFVQIYGPGNASQNDLDMLKKLMKQYFLKSDSNRVLINIDKIYAPFIVPKKLHATLKEFVGEYSQFLSESGFNILPYPEMQKRYTDCVYTIELPGNIQVNFSDFSTAGGVFSNIEFDSTKYQKEFDNLYLNFMKRNKNTKILTYPTHTFSSKRYGSYLHSDGKVYDVLMVQGDDNKKILLAYEHEYGEQNFNPRQTHVYTKSNGEIVAKDFLENWCSIQD